MEVNQTRVAGSRDLECKVRAQQKTQARQAGEERTRSQMVSCSFSTCYQSCGFRVGIRVFFYPHHSDLVYYKGSILDPVFLNDRIHSLDPTILFRLLQPIHVHTPTTRIQFIIQGRFSVQFFLMFGALILQFCIYYFSQFMFIRCRKITEFIYYLFEIRSNQL